MISPDASVTSLASEDLFKNLENLDLEGKLAVLNQLLNEYDRSPPGKFPFPRQVIQEYILKNERQAPINIRTTNSGKAVHSYLD